VAVSLPEILSPEVFLGTVYSAAAFLIHKPPHCFFHGFLAVLCFVVTKPRRPKVAVDLAPYDSENISTLQIQYKSHVVFQNFGNFSLWQDSWLDPQRELNYKEFYICHAKSISKKNFLNNILENKKLKKYCIYPLPQFVFIFWSVNPSHCFI
jgi:hypothetical protein